MCNQVTKFLLTSEYLNFSMGLRVKGPPVFPFFQAPREKLAPGFCNLLEIAHIIVSAQFPHPHGILSHALSPTRPSSLKESCESLCCTQTI